METRRTFPPEFKRKVASLVLDQGSSIRDVAKQFDLGDGVLRRWVKLIKKDSELVAEAQELSA